MIGAAVVLVILVGGGDRGLPIDAIPADSDWPDRVGRKSHTRRESAQAKTKQTWLRFRVEHSKWVVTMDHHRNNRNTPSPCKSF